MRESVCGILCCIIKHNFHSSIDLIKCITKKMYKDWNEITHKNIQQERKKCMLLEYVYYIYVGYFNSTAMRYNIFANTTTKKKVQI